MAAPGRGGHRGAMETEVRALRRAVLVLLALSLARWGVARRSAASPGDAALPTAAAALADSSRALADDARRRNSRLRPGERVDVNTAPEAELDRLPGVGPATAAAIVRARREAPFRTQADLLRVRGVGPRLLERMGPHLALPRVPAAARRPRGHAPSPGPGPAGAAAGVNVNSADSSTLVRLSGIGPALAHRILEERRRRPFVTVDELVRVPGIGPATVEKLRPYVRVRAP